MLATRRELMRRGHDCKLFLLGGTVEREWIRDANAIELGTPDTPKYLRYLQYAFRLPLLLRSFNPDVTLVTNSQGALLMSKFRRLLRLHTDIVFWPHWRLNTSETQNLQLVDYHFAISTGMAKSITEIAGGKKRIYTIFNAIDIDVPSVPRSSTPVFLHVGRLQMREGKRTDDLLRAAAMLKGAFEIRIVGAGKDEEALRQMAIDLGVSDKMHWLGWKKDPWAVIDQASALVLTSSHEGFPMILGEALARGIPCISTDCPSGPEDMIENGRNGWLVPVGDVTQLAVAMQNVIDHLELLPDPQLVRASSMRFGTEQVVDSMCAAIEAERR